MSTKIFEFQLQQIILREKERDRERKIERETERDRERQRESNYHHRINLFRFRLKVYFRSKTEKINLTIEFSTFKLVYVLNSILKRYLCFLGPNLLKKGKQLPECEIMNLLGWSVYKLLVLHLPYVLRIIEVIKKMGGLFPIKFFLSGL